MKCVAKTVSGAIAEIDVEPTDTLAELKAKIEAKLESGGAPVSKVIHKGKVLEEGKPVSDYGVADADMFVVMVNKAKPKAATEPTVDAATKPVAPTAPAQAPAAASAAPAPTSAAVPAGGGSQSYESSAATMVLGEEVEATVMQIMEMGFEREQVMKAMRAAFMNPDRAVEYLMSGIPEQSQRPQGAPGQHDGQDSEDGRAVDPALMAALQQQMLGGQEGPQLLQPLLEQIGQQHPEVLEAIQANQDEFVRLINEPLDPAHLAQAQMAMQTMGGGIPGLGGGGGDDDGGEGAVQIHLTPAEGEALARLEALGFPRQIALEAYLACDKQEEIAANYLFENGMDDAD